MRLNTMHTVSTIKDEKGRELVPRFGFYGCFWSLPIPEIKIDQSEKNIEKKLTISNS